jgi:hypothetical protein
MSGMYKLKSSFHRKTAGQAGKLQFEGMAVNSVMILDSLHGW